MMTPKERAAIQQALEALEVSTDWDVGDKGKQLQSMKAITALREALEQPDEIDWIETNKALAKEIIEMKKQAEQEPVGYFAYDEEHDIWEELTGPNAPGATKLYAAPVRTKDLTDDDLRICFKSTNTSEPLAEGWQGLERFARAVIAADREKNK